MDCPVHLINRMIRHIKSLLRPVRAWLTPRIRRLHYLYLRIRANVPATAPVFTVTGSNGGRSAGDVFLALASNLPKFTLTKPVFVTHPHHAEIAGWFAHRLGMILTDPQTEHWARAARACSIHWGDNHPDNETNSTINNPWRYYLAYGTSPHAAPWRIPPVSARITGKCVLIFPERSDNSRLGGQQLDAFIEADNKRGYICYTNGHLNANYRQHEQLAGTAPLLNLSLTELVSISRDPEIIFLGTRSGLFDILYLTSPVNGATLAVLYPEHPDWIWNARFIRPDIAPQLGDRYFARPNVHEFRTRDFNTDCFGKIFGEPAYHSS